MPKSANLYVRIEPDIKQQAEAILSELGLSASSAISMFYKQIIIHEGIPFEVTLKRNRKIDMSKMTDAELSAELAKGMDDIRAGRTKPVDEVFDAIKEEFKL